jgi:hypothetical protein
MVRRAVGKPEMWSALAPRRLCLDHGVLGSDPLSYVTCTPKRAATRITAAKSLSHQ